VDPVSNAIAAALDAGDDLRRKMPVDRLPEASWVEQDPVVIRNVNLAVKWQPGAKGWGKTNGRWRNIDARWRCAELLLRVLDGGDGYSLQRRLDASGSGLVLCKQWMPVDGNGHYDWKYYSSADPELIAEHAIEPAKREEAQRQLNERR
jgi:hypothetical protein